MKEFYRVMLGRGAVGDLLEKTFILYLEVSIYGQFSGFLMLSLQFESG